MVSLSRPPVEASLSDRIRCCPRLMLRPTAAQVSRLTSWLNRRARSPSSASGSAWIRALAMARPSTRSPRNSRRSLSLREPLPRVLEWVSARVARSPSLKRCPRAFSSSENFRFRFTGVLSSAHEVEESGPADIEWPAPRRQKVERIRLIERTREEDNLGTTHEVFQRHVADPPRRPAIGRVVAVVAHHEVVARRHLVDGSIVERPVGLAVEHLVFEPVRQRLLE